MNLPVNYHATHYTKRRLIREEYIRLQEGLCYHCHSPLTEDPSNEVINLQVKRWIFPKNFFKYPVHLHHDHKTGLTLGAVHCHCNAVLWQYHGE